MSEVPAVLTVNRSRLIDTAFRLIEVPSPTCRGGDVLDVIERLLSSDGFSVERVAAGHPDAPAVVVKYDTGRPGPTIQFNGHIDTVHLPFIAPSIVGPNLIGSGSCDMKGGTAAAIEALMMVRDANALPCGSILFTAHDLHEAPWGDSHQLDTMIRSGIHGDAVLLPEPLSAHLPTIGRGQACWKATIRRNGPAVHEVMRPLDEPNVIAAAGLLINRIMQLDRELGEQIPTAAGRPTAFIGQVHGGEIFNGYAHDCWIEGTRRWLPGTDRLIVERDFRALVEVVANESGTMIDLHYQLVRDAFILNETDRFVSIFQEIYTRLSQHALPLGPKPFVDDGNSFSALAGVPAITHGPKAGGQHTLDEWVEIDDLVRVAQLYAEIAVAFCSGQTL
jgi:acetylornithine deacetylase/succinyl-diaminopimelate desuccinylase-like protein